MPNPKATGAGPSGKADCRRGAGVPRCHHCLMVIAPPAGCLSESDVLHFVCRETKKFDLHCFISTFPGIGYKPFADRQFLTINVLCLITGSQFQQ